MKKPKHKKKLSLEKRLRIQKALKSRKSGKKETRRQVWAQHVEASEAPNILRLGPDGWITMEASALPQFLSTQAYLREIAKKWEITTPIPVVLVPRYEYIKLCQKAEYNTTA